VVLNGQNHWPAVLDERRIVDDLEDVLEEDLGGPVNAVIAVVDDRFSVVAVPDVEFDAAAAALQHAPVLLHVAVAVHLEVVEVGVVRRADEVVRQRLRHVLVD